MTGSDAVLHAAVLLFRASSSSPGHVPLYEESIVLVRATSEDDARALAEALGRGEECSYPNEVGETIQWSFEHVVDVQTLKDDALDHGTTVYSRHFRDLRAYRAFEPGLDGSLEPSADTGSRDEHVAWVADAINAMSTIRPGMARLELEKVFVPEEGGGGSRSGGKYRYRACPYFKVDVRFEFDRESAAPSPAGSAPEADDRIATISCAFLDWPITD